MIWFTSDTHFGHKNILKYTDRPFSSVREMDEALIENWNNRVNSDDEVYHLGDVALCSPNKLQEILARLNGRIYLIAGNHDKSAKACRDIALNGLKTIPNLEISDPDGYQGKQLIVLFHYAMRVWQASHYGTYHLYGHSHGELPDDPNSLSFDVGVDCHNYAPINYDEIKHIMSKKSWKSPQLRAK